MKACKINIKQEWVDVLHGVYREAVWDRARVASINNENLQTETVATKEVTYFPMKVYEPGQLQYTTYLVKEDERKVFTDLLTIETTSLNETIEREVNEKMEIKTYEIHAKTFKAFRELPWYKRLFVKYEFLFP